MLCYYNTMSNERQIEKARVFATAAHAAVGQLRKYTNDPYIVHPLSVATRVALVNRPDAAVCAALLHDVLEDTKVTEATLRTEFGNEVTSLVVWLTAVEVPGNRQTRKVSECRRLYLAPAEAQTIKLADLIDNAKSIIEHDPKFAKVFLSELRDLLSFLCKGDPELWAEAYEIWKEHHEKE